MPAHEAADGAARQPGGWRSRAYAVLAWGLFLAVIGFVGRYAWNLWHQVGAGPARVSWSWAAAAAGASIVAWLPSCWYWRYLLQRHAGRLPAVAVLRAYYCGHLGKYVPGKAAAIVIRTALLRPLGVPVAVGAYTATLEALVYMASGAVLAAALAPLTGGLDGPLGRGLAALNWHGATRWLGRAPEWLTVLPLVAAVAAVTALALLAGRLERFAHSATAREEPQLPSRGAWVFRVLSGFLPFLAAWWLQGLVLGLTLRAAGAGAFNLADWPDWTFDAAVAMLGGFVAAFAPGGLGVREGLLLLLLEPAAPRQAVLAAALWRAASLAGEAAVATVLYYVVPARAGNAGR